VDPSAHIANWSSPGFDDKDWRNVVEVEAPKGDAVAQQAPLNRIGNEIPAVAVSDLGGGRYEIDFGTNLTGWLRWKMPANAGVVKLSFADARNVYDVFAFSEDDLRPSGGDMIPRILAFQDDYGWRRVLFPNRFEWNPRGPALKTYIDGMLRPGLLAPFEAALPDERFLKDRQGAKPLTFQRATNPHCGFFAITAEQLTHWMAQPQFGDQDCSFISPLESAATLGILKTFPIYKPFGRDMGWLEIEHLDTRFSGMNLPGRPPPTPQPS
jgi:hypothetical protein